MASHLKSGLDNFKFWYMEAQSGISLHCQIPCHTGVPFQSFYFIVQMHIPLCLQVEIYGRISQYNELKDQHFHYTVLVALIICNCHLYLLFLRICIIMSLLSEIRINIKIQYWTRTTKLH